MFQFRSYGPTHEPMIAIIQTAMKLHTQTLIDLQAVDVGAAGYERRRETNGSVMVELISAVVKPKTHMDCAALSSLHVNLNRPIAFSKSSEFNHKEFL